MRISTHPGEVLREEFMIPCGLSANKLSMHLGVPLSRITELVKEKRNVTVDTAARLPKFFGTSPEFWMNLQTQHDFSKIQAKKAAGLDAIQKFDAVAACG